MGGEEQGRGPSPAIYKIKGIEYLPEGFLELDPLLFKDEYQFPSQFNEKLFDNEQRKLKALRRKQYAQKGHQKQREVTIFVLDEANEKIVEFLEKWYFKFKRRMNEEEVRYAAEKFETTLEQMHSIQNAYLRRMRAVNSKHLEDYLDDIRGRSDRNRQKELPESLQKYFWKNRGDPFQHVRSVVSYNLNRSLSSQRLRNTSPDASKDSSLQKGQPHSRQGQTLSDIQILPESNQRVVNSPNSTTYLKNYAKNLKRSASNNNVKPVDRSELADVSNYFDLEFERVMKQINQKN